MPRSTDKLAFALGTPEPVSRQYFRAVFDHLYLTDAAPAGYSLDDIDWHRRITQSNLEALAICDFEFRDRQTVHSCAPFLGRLPHSGFPKAVLFGARTPSTLRQLFAAVRERRSVASVTVTSQPGSPLLPNRISVQAEDLPLLQTIAQASGTPLLDTEPSWSLLSYAYSVEEYTSALTWTAGFPDLNWIRDDFNTATRTFGGISADLSPRLTRYRHPQQAHRRVYYLIEEARFAEVEVAWARFHILHKAQRNVLLFDERLAVVLLPLTVPLPRLLARGLVACSGFAPQEIRSREHGDLRAYVQVPEAYANLLANKLSQTLLRTKLTELPREVND